MNIPFNGGRNFCRYLMLQKLVFVYISEQDASFLFTLVTLGTWTVCILWVLLATLLKNLFSYSSAKKHFSKKLTTASLAEMGGGDVQGVPPMAQPAPRQSYTPMAGKPTPSTHEPPQQWNQAPVTMIYQWKNKGGRDGGKRMIQRLKEESGRQENAVLSTWRWCKQSW